MRNRKNNIFDDFFNFFKNSFKTYFFNDKAEKEILNTNWKFSFFSAWIIAILTSILPLIFGFIFSIESSKLNSLGLSDSTMNFLYSIFLHPIFAFSAYGIAHFILKTFGGRAKLSKTFSVLNSLSIFPIVLLGVLELFLFLIPNQSLELLLFTLIFIVLFWTVFVNLQFQSSIQKISIIRTFLALLVVPLGLLFILFILVFTILVSLGLIK